MTLTSRKTQQEVRMQLDKLDLELLRRVIREELEAHERRKSEPHPGYWYAAYGLAPR